MIDPRYLKVTKEDSTQYPDRPSVKCDMMGTDNKIYETEYLKEEVDLALYLKCSIFPKLSGTESTKLLKLIESYGNMRYEDGNFEATYEG